MRFFSKSLLFTLLASVVVADSPQKQPQKATAQSGDSSPAEDAVEGSTIFNGIRVPPLPEIDGEIFNASVKDGYWFVKHFS